MILCNGAPKTGTNLLLKAIRMFPGQMHNCKHGHVPYDQRNKLQKFTKHVQIYRNPRNQLISWLRMKNIPPTLKNMAEQMPVIMKYNNEHEIWLRKAALLNIHVVRFEYLLTDPNELQKLADYLKLDLIPNHFEKLWGGSYTFTNNLSNWQDHWPKPIENAYTPFMRKWREAHGLHYEQLMGINPQETFLRQLRDGYVAPQPLVEVDDPVMDDNVGDRRTKKPANFTGVILILSRKTRINYHRGDLIDVVDGNTDLGEKVWNNPRFSIRFVWNKTVEDFSNMKEAMMDDAGVKIKNKRRKFKFDMENAQVQSKKEVWAQADIDNIVQERIKPLVQPNEIIIP